MTPIELAATIVNTSSSPSNPMPGLPGGIIAWIICYKHRRSEIGGWLLFFFWQLYGSILMTAIFFVAGFNSYVPESYSDARTYHLLLISVVPQIVIMLIEVAIGTMLLSVRTWDMFKLMRFTVLAAAIWFWISVSIDSRVFPESVILDVMSAVTSTAWTAYLFLSKRVRHVFETHDWEIAVRRIHPDPDDDRLSIV